MTNTPTSEFLLTLFIFIGVISLTLLLFGGWAASKTARGIGRTVRNLMVGAGGREQRACAHAECRQLNPPGAKFCRRCGRPLPGGLIRA